MDNLRWVTVLLVLLYHVVYFYNNKGVFGGIGGFGDGPQYQDVVMYILYPWFMPLLFLLAGVSARYALENYPAREWFRARTRKLLVPSTIGLFVFHWMTGYFNTAVAAKQSTLAGIPGVAKYIAMAISGTGPLWFIQDLWLFSLLLLLVRSARREKKVGEKTHPVPEAEDFRFLDDLPVSYSVYHVTHAEHSRLYDAQIVYVNHKYEELGGLPAEAVLGHRVRELYPHIGENWYMNVKSAACDGTPVEYDYVDELSGKRYRVSARQIFRADYCAVTYVET
jgi:PAS domain-containing protein